VIADPSTPPALRDRLAVVLDARRFAGELGLEVDGQFTSYVPWPGDRVVTTVVATRPGEVEPAGFRFPLVGRLPYKGFFDRDKAAAEAAHLRSQGLDVCEVGVPAYSTLGWLDDPVTGPLARSDEGPVVETILHELVHATVFVQGNAAFNEGVASFIGEEGSVRFYAEAGHSEQASTAPGDERDVARRELEQRARRQIAELPLDTGEVGTAAESLRLNDACLAILGTYSADLERLAAKLDDLGGDLRAFVARVRAAAESPDPLAAVLEP
jgi:predicted aminopeptidase